MSRKKKRCQNVFFKKKESKKQKQNKKNTKTKQNKKKTPEQVLCEHVEVHALIELKFFILLFSGGSVCVPVFLHLYWKRFLLGHFPKAERNMCVQEGLLKTLMSK